jgi:hypothetical protein
MIRTPVNVRGRRCLYLGAFAAVAIAALIGFPHSEPVTPVFLLDHPSSPPIPFPPEPESNVSAGVTWDGTNISAAGTIGSAFVLQGEQTVKVVFEYTVQGTGPGPATAEVVLTYLGDALTSTGTATGAGSNGSGTATFSWSFGNLVELTEGAYHLTASLLDVNGSTLWSQGFYINVEAPFRVSSGLFVFLIVLGAVEGYSIAVALRRRKIKHLPRPARRGPPPPPGGRGPPYGGP